MIRKCPRCPRPAVKGRLCAPCQLVKTRAWTRRARYRQSIGLCGRCLEPQAPGRNYCARHVKNAKDRSARQRDLAAAQRGWKFARVAV